LWRIFCGLGVSNNNINYMGNGGLLWNKPSIKSNIIQDVQNQDKLWNYLSQKLRITKL
jgi:hypothetical protein